MEQPPSKRKTNSKERYPIVHCNLQDLGYYWECVKIRSSDYSAFLQQTDMELQLHDGTATGELKKVYKSIKKIGLLNPLIISIYHGRLYVCVGCQRLAALRVLAQQNFIAKDYQVPCRITDNFDEEIVQKFHSYKTWK